MAAVGLDHRYATHFYRACGGDLEVVQEQLEHASIKTTTIYVKVTKEDKVRAADALAKAYRSSQQNRETGLSWRRRVPVNLGPTPRVFPPPVFLEAGAIVIDTA